MKSEDNGESVVDNIESPGMETPVIKPDFYDDFKCIASNCSLTCCQAWEIAVDTSTYHKWLQNKEYSDFLCSKVIQKSRNKDSSFHIKLNKDTTCPFLDQQGLCQIVTECGEDYLSDTCKTFPRQKFRYHNYMELSLSCACPEVVDLVMGHAKDIIFMPNANSQYYNRIPQQIILRNAMISLMQCKNLTLKEKILINFHMLLTVREGNKRTEDIIDVYMDQEFLKTFACDLKEAVIPTEDFLWEVNELFLDVTQNYRNEKQYSAYLKDICKIAESLITEEEHLSEYWYSYEKIVSSFDKFLQNYFVLKIYSGCIREDIDEMILSFQMIIIEYLMIRHSLFLKSGKDGNNLYNQRKDKDTQLRDYTVLYSRMIDYNQDGMKEFLSDSFEDVIWELGYLMLLLG